MHVVTALVLSAAAVAAAEPENLAAGKRVRFLPAPNYSLTAKGGTDETDLTDGVLSDRQDQRLWFDSKAVGFSYAGLQQLVVDLGSEQAVGEVAIRFLGGSFQPGISFPVWVDVVASRDGRTYSRVATFSRWNEGDRAKYGVPPENGTAWVHRLSFPNLRTRARYVGLSFYCSGLTVTDELWVLRGPADAPPLSEDPAAAVAFTVDAPQLYFHKPVVHFSTNIATPNPVGVFFPGEKETAVTVRLDLPPGVRLLEGSSLGGAGVAEAKTERLADGFTRYALPAKVSETRKNWGRLYLAGEWKEGQEGEIRYQVITAGGDAPAGRQRLRAVSIAPAPRPKRLLTGMGWWGLSETRAWPDAAKAFRALGFSYVPLFPRWVKEDAEWAFLEGLRKEGFRVVSVDSPLHEMVNKNKNNPELMCQLPGGPGKRLCPTYRGPAYQAELQRVRREAALARPSLLTADIELWSWTGPVDAPKCSRCQADFARSGLKEWKEWQVVKGIEMWRDLVTAAREGAREAGGPVPEVGGYDFRPGEPYQFFWSVDRLYPEWMHGSQVSTYSPLEPHHLALIGDAVRKDRKALGRSDVIPWLAPGDAGVFPGWAFRDALLECFANGSRGLLFWSSRVWDTESLVAYADAVRIAAPVEDLIVDGEPLEGATSEPAVRVSGMRMGDDVFLLAADYGGAARGPVRLRVPVARPCVVEDLETGKEIARITPAEPAFTVRFARPGARPFRIRGGNA